MSLIVVYILDFFTESSIKLNNIYAYGVPVVIAI